MYSVVTKFAHTGQAMTASQSQLPSNKQFTTYKVSYCSRFQHGSLHSFVPTSASTSRCQVHACWATILSCVIEVFQVYYYRVQPQGLPTWQVHECICLLYPVQPLPCFFQPSRGFHQALSFHSSGSRCYVSLDHLQDCQLGIALLLLPGARFESAAFCPKLFPRLSQLFEVSRDQKCSGNRSLFGVRT